MSPFSDSVEAEHGGMSGRDAVSMLVDEELTVSTIDRVVQNALVQPDLDVLDREHWTVERKRVADLGWHGIADAFAPGRAG